MEYVYYFIDGGSGTSRRGSRLWLGSGGLGPILVLPLLLWKRTHDSSDSLGSWFEYILSFMTCFSFKYDLSVKGRPLLQIWRGLQGKMRSTMSNMWIVLLSEFLKNGYMSTHTSDCLCVSPSLGCTAHVAGGGGEEMGLEDGRGRKWASLCSFLPFCLAPRINKI